MVFYFRSSVNWWKGNVRLQCFKILLVRLNINYSVNILSECLRILIDCRQLSKTYYNVLFGSSTRDRHARRIYRQTSECAIYEERRKQTPFWHISSVAEKTETVETFCRRITSGGGWSRNALKCGPGWDSWQNRQIQLRICDITVVYCRRWRLPQ